VATISSLLADHVTLRVRSVDRLFLQGYVPRLMTEGQLIRFLLDRGFPIPSPALLGKIGRGYVDQINQFIVDNEIPTVKFVKGDVKEQIARKHFGQAERDGRYGVVMVAIAQEKTSAWRGWRDGGPDGHPHFVYRRQSIFPNNYYFYIRDPDWGPSFIKTIAYAPFPLWIYLNGNEWGKQQAAQQGIAFRALDNGFAACEDAPALAEICHRLSAQDVRLFFERWQGTLPSPLTNEDRARGYGHALAFGQLEISDTRVFDRPAAGRAWFEQTLPGQLTLGRPDQAAATDAARLQELSAEYRALAAQRAALEERWLVLSEQLEA
jgi:catechol 2,3-dioxygenase-like lactoylglutathione lyase family enzyme